MSLSEYEISKQRAKAGRKGAKARADKLTREQRRTIAVKASKAAAKARSAKKQRAAAL